MDDIIDFHYTSSELTHEVNRIPNTFGLLNAMNLAPAEAKASTLVRLDYRDGQIFVLAAKERGTGASQAAGQDEHSGKILEIPHFPLTANISPADLDNLLEVVDGKVTPASLDRELFAKIEAIHRHHAITREYLRLSMLRGVIKDGNGKTLHDLYGLFGIQKKTISLGLDSDTTDVREKLEEANDHIGSNLLGDTSAGTETIVSTRLFNKFVAHPNVEKFWLNAQNSSEHRELKRDYRGKNYGRVLELGDVVVREYKGKMPFRAANGEVSTADNVEAGKGHAFPVGTQNLFRTFEGPAYHINRVNQRPEMDEEGLAILITAKVLDHGEGVELKSQSNVLPVCKQPNVLVELTE
jgi:hypothetical protein